MSFLAKLESIGIDLGEDLSQIDCFILQPALGSSPTPPAQITQESVVSGLRSIRFKLSSAPSQIDCASLDAVSLASPVMPASRMQTDPLVSCMMMTRGNINLMSYSLACYQRQTYANRELVVVTEPEAGDKVRAFIAQQEILNVKVFVAPSGLTIGDHRNLATARASGAIIATWDDDDLSDPLRLDITVQVLRQTGAAAAFLSRLLIWWPQRKVAAISRRRLWEQSMAAWRAYMPIYAPLQRGGTLWLSTGLLGRTAWLKSIARFCMSMRLRGRICGVQLISRGFYQLPTASSREMTLMHSTNICPTVCPCCDIQPS